MISNAVTSLRIVLLVPLYLLLVTPARDAAPWGALSAFLLAGLTDVLDGFLARRLNEVSGFGAMLDLIADRLLTATAVLGLVAAADLRGLPAVAGAVLIGRDLVVASFNEARPGLGIRVTPVERVKITFQFLGLGLLLAPEFWRPTEGFGLHALGGWSLELSAALALVTLVDYGGRTVRAFRQQ